LARTIASKIAIAARIDFFRKGEKDPALLDQLNKRIAEIQEKYKEPKIEQKTFKREQMRFGYNKSRTREGYGRGREGGSTSRKFDKKYKRKFSRKNRF